MLDDGMYRVYVGPSPNRLKVPIYDLIDGGKPVLTGTQQRCPN